MREERKGKGTPLVSICCLTYNHEAFIRDALEGFLRQRTDFDFEILIYDDASTDGTARIIREYAMGDPERIRPHPAGGKPIFQRGHEPPAVHLTFPGQGGKYIAMCEGDDYWTDPDKLQRQVDYLESHPGCSLCIHSARILTVDGSRSDRRMRPYRGNRRIRPEEIIDKACGYATASMVFPSRLVKELPSYYDGLPGGDIPCSLWRRQRGTDIIWTVT